MPKMNLSHFEAALLFALFTSVVLGVVTKRTDRDRLHYGLRFRLLRGRPVRPGLADALRPRVRQSSGLSLRRY